MRHKMLKLSALLILGLGLTRLQAQEVVTAGGGEATGSGGSASYSVGQMVYTTNIGTNGSVATGVQQPFEISFVTGIEEANGISLIVSPYPNPTTDNLTLKVSSSSTLSSESLSYQLFDVWGRLLKTQDKLALETQIEMQGYKQGTYLLKIVGDSRQVQTFKIIKK